MDLEAENEELLALRGVGNRILRKLERRLRKEESRAGRSQRRLAKSHRDRNFLENHSHSPYKDVENGYRQNNATLEQHKAMHLKVLDNFRSEYKRTKTLVQRVRDVQSD